MVESVNSSLAARTRLQTSYADTAVTKQAQPASNTAPINSVDKVVLSDSVSVQLAESLAQKGPPFDLERVSRIKQAVAEGRYPVDPQRITDSIFQDYSALLG